PSYTGRVVTIAEIREQMAAGSA
ncbi:hypothetical protein LCGC14_2907260, partial [marine sediment metagenome]